MRVSLIVLCLIMWSKLCLSQDRDTASITYTSQDIIQTANNISSKSLQYIDNKYSKLTNRVRLQSEKLLRRMQQKEQTLQQKLQGIDSIKAQELFNETQSKYQELQSKLKAPIDKAVANPLTEYIPGVDSLQTLFKFLSQSPAAGLSTEKLAQIQGVSEQVQELQARLQQANEIQDFIRQRESQLKTSLANTVLAKEVLSMNKDVVYYQQRLQEYKALLHDRKKLEQKVFAAVRTLPAFQKFMRKHSYLAQLFRIPDDPTSTALTLSPGLQTRASVQNLLGQRFAGVSTSTGTSVNPQQYMQQQTQQAAQQLNTLKDKINRLGGGSSDMTLPDFKPNNQKTKSFFKRLEYGFNVQSQKGTSYLPAISDISLTLGYKLSDKKTLGLGASYKLGWGHGFNDIHFSSEGVGLRSYADLKFKGSIWVTGGFEYNYFQHFNNFQEIKNLDVWRRSALAGLMKKYKAGKKEGSIQMLYDFLAQKEVPQAQPLKFRVGYTF